LPTKQATGNCGQEIGDFVEPSGHELHGTTTLWGRVEGSRRSPGDWQLGAQYSSMNGHRKIGKQTGKNIWQVGIRVGYAYLRIF
jgi:hypothetical protein